MSGGLPGDRRGRDEVVSDFGISLKGPSVTSRRPPGLGQPVSAGEVADTDPDPRFAVAAAVRRITATLVGRPLSPATLGEAAATLAAVADRLEEDVAPGRRSRSQPDPAGHPQDFFPTSPVIGFANPVSPPVEVEATEDGLRGSAFFDYQYEGPPKCVHGGVIAMVFDELLGAANIAAGCPGMTGTLTIRYRRPTPLRTLLRLEARCIGRQGRKITTWGAIFRDDELLAEAEGLFVELGPDRFLQVALGHADPAKSGQSS